MLSRTARASLASTSRLRTSTVSLAHFSLFGWSTSTSSQPQQKSQSSPPSSQPRQSQPSQHPTQPSQAPTANQTTSTQAHKKSLKEMDDELKAKMAGISGDGGEAGIEYEDGQPVAMKRSVKNNMFRYI